MHHGLDTPSLQRRRIAAASLLLLAGCGGGNTERDDDPVLPTLQISSDAPGQATGPFTVRFSFSAAVRNFLGSRIAVRNGIATGAALTRLSDTVYTLAVTPTANFRGVGEVQVLTGAFQDATGALTSSVAHSFGQEIDTVVIGAEPTLTISHNVSGAAATAAVSLTFSFSADVGNSFTQADVQLTAGTLTSFTRSSGTLYTAVATLPAGTQGRLIVFVDADSFQTPAGAANLQAYSKLVHFDMPA